MAPDRFTLKGNREQNRVLPSFTAFLLGDNGICDEFQMGQLFFSCTMAAIQDLLVMLRPKYKKTRRIFIMDSGTQAIAFLPTRSFFIDFGIKEVHPLSLFEVVWL